MSERVVLFSTAPTREVAERIAKHLVENRLAACVNVSGPITSIYRWKEAVESAEELLLIIKTTAEKFATIREAYKEIHPYEVPELIQLDIAKGLPEYLSWIDKSVI